MGGCVGKSSASSKHTPTSKQSVLDAVESSPSQNSISGSPSKNDVHAAAALKVQQDPKKKSLLGQVSEGKVSDFYDIGVELGRGSFSVVKEGTHKETKTKFALKFIDKQYVDKEDFKLLLREIEIMKKVNHPNVLSMKEIFEDAKQIVIVTDLVNGGELFFKIVKRGSYSEKDAAKIVKQIANGVKYLHSLEIAHRDLKPENLLCQGDGNDVVIKIADFGLSKIFAGGQTLETSCGTPDYAAPEVLTGGKAYDKSVDLWSVGVITYVLLCGYPPFYGDSHVELFEKITHAKYTFPEPEWDFISDTAKDFIRNLLSLDPADRMTAEQCLEHPFLKGDGGNALLDIEVSMSKYNVQRKKAKNARSFDD